MFFRKNKKYQMNMDTANTILQNVFAAESQTPNTIPFDKLVLREKANTRFYDRFLVMLSVVVLFVFLSPLAFIPITGNPITGFSSGTLELVDDYVEKDCLYLQVDGAPVLYKDAYLETTDGTRYSPISFDEKTGTLCFPYIENLESNIYIPTMDGGTLHLLLTPQ